MKEKLSSGAFVDVTIAPITLSYQLLQAVTKEFAKAQFDISMENTESLSFGNLIKNNMSNVIKGFSNVIASDEILKILMACAESSIYEKNGIKQKVSLSVFEEEENRADFFEVMKCIAIRNLKPFFHNLLTK